MKSQSSIIVVGGGPAGLMTAEILAKAGCKVTVYEQKASLGRKFLLAGRGGLNLTHSEPLNSFKNKYGSSREILSPVLDSFTPDDLRSWSENLGQKTFEGTSGRVFPESFKASPLLRSWVKYLVDQGVEFKMQRKWEGWNASGKMFFSSKEGTECIDGDAVVLALGGASWPHLGSNGLWQNHLAAKNIEIMPLRPANCGFYIEWSAVFREKFSGTPLKNISLTFDTISVKGELMIDKHGIEGGAVYALSHNIRTALEHNQDAVVTIDLKPDFSLEKILEIMRKPRKKQSLSTFLQKNINLPSLATHLLREADNDIASYSGEELAKLIKAIPLRLQSPFPIEKSISTAGGVSWNEIDENFMLRKLPGIFVAGEMIDWEAPTGGYLLQGCFSTANFAAKGILNYLKL